jgi:hypothetical protein
LASSSQVLGVFASVLFATTGCSGQRTFLTGGPTVGQLKTSLSHLEYENEQLKNTVAKLQRENRSTEDRLVQEQIDNGDLTARLDDARNLLRDRGLDPDVRVGSRREGDGLENALSDREGLAPRTLPTGQKARQRRKPPFAHIPGQVDAPPPPEAGDASTPSATGSGGSRRPRSRRRLEEELDHHSYNAGPDRWLPVADGTGPDSTPAVFR